MGRLISEHIGYPFHPSFYTVRDPRGKRGDEVDRTIVEQLLESSPFWLERGKAVQAYAMLEQALSMLFANLSGTTELTAATIFYKITSSGARNAIIEKLIKQKHRRKFNLFWNPYLKLLRPLDTRRNEIVHWMTATISQLDIDGTIICGLLLIPPNIHSFFPEMTYLSIQDLISFREKCDEFARLCNIFRRVSSDDSDQFEFAAWLDIFQQPFQYPLPEDHLLYKMPSIPQTPL